jgi:hypothetical protein
MRRADAPGGEYVGVPGAKRVQRRDNVGFIVSNNASLLEVDSDIRQVIRDEADVLVLGPSGQDFVAYHQNARGDDVTHNLSLLLAVNAYRAGASLATIPSGRETLRHASEHPGAAFIHALL